MPDGPGAAPAGADDRQPPAAGAAPPTRRGRRPPPRFRLATVCRRVAQSPRLVRLTLTGDDLAGLVVEEPAASVRVLLPDAGNDLEIPRWTGNEFRLGDGRRPTIRTLTPARLDPEALELDVCVVLHGRGAAAEWAAHAAMGSPVAISGPGRGYVVDRGGPAWLLAGDETALPAMAQVLAALPAVPVSVAVEAPGATRIDLPAHPRATVAWLETPDREPPGTAVLEAVRRAELADGVRVWVAGEAAGVQRVRRHLFEARGLPRAHVVARGYWKLGRSAEGGAGEDAGD